MVMVHDLKNHIIRTRDLTHGSHGFEKPHSKLMVRGLWFLKPRVQTHGRDQNHETGRHSWFPTKLRPAMYTYMHMYSS